MSVGDNLELIPSFDHGLSLGSTDEDEDKPNLIVSDYVERYSQSCFQEGYNKVPTLTVFDRAARLYPDAARIWQGKLAAITPSQINEIFERIPEARITPTADNFARRLLEYNREKILNVNLELPQTLSEGDSAERTFHERISTGVTLQQLFESEAVTLSPEDRANLETADNFATEQQQIKVQTRAQSQRQSDDRTRGFSR